MAVDIAITLAVVFGLLLAVWMLLWLLALDEEHWLARAPAMVEPFVLPIAALKAFFRP